MAHIDVDHLSVQFPIYGLNARSFKLQMLSRLTPGGKLQKSQNTMIIKALDDLSFQAEKGDRIGLVGYNGAGKSTLLRALANIYEPIRGAIHVRGKISTLFHTKIGMPDATGYENILFGGLMQGVSRQVVNQHVPDIVEFTELGDYLKMPVRAYSSGMQIRLGFAIATSFSPQILLIDEVIGVGDNYFIEKARERLIKFVDRSDIVVIASHNKSILERTCNKIMILQHGKLHYFGDLNTGLEIYSTMQPDTPNP